MVKDRHPSVAELIVTALVGGLEVRSIQAVTQCTRVLERTGFDCLGHIWLRGEPQVWQKKKKRTRVSHTRVGNSRPLRQLSDTT